MAKAQLYSILGGDEAHAANIWPRSRIKSMLGFSSNDDPLPLLKYLQGVLEFDAVRPGASPDPVDHAARPGIPPGQVGLIANLVVKSADPTALPLVITQMPDVAFYLVKTLPALPARLYVTHTDKGTELLIEDLPVEIQVPASLISTWIVPMAPTSNPFRTGNAPRDSLYVQLEDNKPSSIFVYVRVRMTEEMDFVIEPTVPISIGPCRFLGLPCLGLHDINFVPSPNLQGDHTIREQALDWTRHPLDRLQVDAQYGGQLTVRTVDIDSTNTPLKDILQRMASPVLSETAEFVLEDVALPFWSIATLPLPSHGLFGLRRGIKAGDDLKEAFGISGSPLNIKYLLGSDFTLLVDQLLLQTPAKEDADQFIFVQTEVYKSDTPPDKAMPMTIGIADDWTVQLGQHRPTGSLVFTLFGATLKLYGFKLGFAIKRALAHTSFGDMIQVLLDLGLSTKDSPLVDSKFFQIRSLSGKDLDVVLNDVGWNLGQFSLEGLSFPEGVQIIAFDIARLIVDDMGWVTENNGGRYFSFSGGISLFGLGQPTPSKPGTGLQDNDRGFGFRFHRLRGRVGGNSHAPALLLDGITLSLEVGRFSIRGTGLYSEFTLEGTEYKEFGLALLASFDLFLYRVALGLALFYGRATGNQSFTYWMFAFQFSPIPLYIVELTNVRMLLAGNVVPDLDNFQDEGYAQNMRLFRWYQAHQSAITLPDNRKLASWKRQEHTFAMGIGASFTVPVGNFMVTFDLFGFYEYTRESVELMIALEAFLAEGNDPIGYGAIEIDLDQGKFGFMLGVTLTLAQVLKIHLPDFLTNMFALTGSLYVGNKPSTFAIGQLNDQSTWLTYRFDKRVPFLGGGKLEVALCLQTVDAPGGPSGFGFLFDAAGSQPFGFGLVEFYASMAMMAGIWRNESTVSGFLMQIEAGLRIKVFWVFNFGISVKIDFHYLGPAPTYRALDVQFRIETPWWLPDVTVHFSKSWDSQQPSQMKAVSPPLQPGGSLRPGLPPSLKLQSAPAPAAAPSDTHPDVLITSLPNQETDQHALYHMDELRALKELSLPDSDLDKLLPVSVDSAIALNFKPGVDDQTTTGENTPVGASKQQSNDLSVNYELVALGIRRRPRFGTNAGTWTTLLAPEDTRYKSPADFPPGSDIEAHYTSAISYIWDRDMVSSGQLDPRRLLINADTPYSFLMKNPEGDENTARNEPQWPCASGGNIPIPWHELNFLSLPLGVQPPVYQTFSNSRSTLHFVGSIPGVVAPGSQLSNTPHVARLIFDGRSDGTFALVNFDQPAASFEASLYWSQHAWSMGGFLAIETYYGLKLVQQHILDLSLTNHLNLFSQGGQEGLTGVVFRYSTGNIFRVTPNAAWIEILDMGYYDLKDSIDQFNKSQKANARSKRALSGSGKLAWLPNHDYEISLATRVTLAHKSSGQQQTEVMQKAYFRTKGLPGLNAVDRLGDEIEPFLESYYPDTLPATTLYRSEVALLAFNEKFNTLWPVDRAPAPNDPGELQQILAWVLAIDKPGSPTSGAERVSQTDADWVVFHRRDPFPIRVNPRTAKLCNDVVSSGKRIASTLDPMRQRLERMLQRPEGCQAAPQGHSSRLVIHQPVNLDGGTLWEPKTLYRANLRVKDAPFVERDPFESPDASAFDISKDGPGSDCSWSSLNGTLRASQTALIADAGTHHYAIFGEDNWNHVQVHCTVDPHSFIAGIAIGVERQGAFVQRSVLVLIDEHSGGTLRLVELRDGNERELDSKPLLTQASAPYALEVMAFDDQVRARVGDVVVQAPRDDVRDGRLALVTQRGNATFTRLLVESLDAYRFQFMTSRFASFVDHIQSADSNTMTIITGNPFGPGSQLASVDALFSSSATQIAAVMKPDADPEQRQRLFDQWVGVLALPLQRRLTGLHLSNIQSGNSTDLLLLEGPEPLPFSKDVTLKLFQRSISSPHSTPHLLPGGHMPSQALSNWVASLTFSNDHVSGPVPVHLVPSLSDVSQFVIALPSANGLALYVYDVAMRPGLRGAAELSSVLKQVAYPHLGSLLNPDPLVKKFANMQANQLAVIDRGGNISNFISINPHNMVRFVSVPVSILTNGSETHALIIPVDATGKKNVQLTSGSYRFDFSIDRVRYRQQVPDNASNYRAQASFTKSW